MMRALDDFGLKKIWKFRQTAGRMKMQRVVWVENRQKRGYSDVKRAKYFSVTLQQPAGFRFED